MNNNPHNEAELTSMLNLQVKPEDKKEEEPQEAQLGATIEAIDTSWLFKKNTK